MRTLLLIIALAVCGIAEAVPTELQHQGRLMDNLGVPFGGSHSLAFRLYESQSATVPVWQETLTVDFDDGYYALLLGTDPGNPLDDAYFKGGALFVGLAVDGGAELPDRLPVSSTPFARRAAVAESVDGGVVDASEIRINGLTVINGSATFVGALSDQTLSGLGCVTGELPIFDGANWTCSSGGITALSCTTDQIAIFNGANWDCGVDLDTLENLGCIADDIITFDGNYWTCTPRASSSVSWNNLQDIPNSLTDIGSLTCADSELLGWNGAQSEWGCSTSTDTTLSQGTVISFVTDSAIDLAAGSTLDGQPISNTDALGDLICSDGDVAQSVGGVWGCAPASSADTLGTLSCAGDDIIVYNSNSSSWECEPLALSDADTLGDLQCTSDGDVAAWNDSNNAWECTSLILTDSDSLADLATSCASGAIPVWRGSYWSCDIDTLASLICSTDEIPLWDGLTWTCAAASSATVTWGDITGMPAALDDFANTGLGESALPFTGLDEVSGGALDNEFTYTYGLTNPTTINDGQENNPTSSAATIPNVGPALSFNVTVNTTGNSDHAHVQYLLRQDFNSQITDYTIVSYGDYTGSSGATDVWSVSKTLTNLASTPGNLVYPDGTWTLLAYDNEDLAGNPNPGMDGSFTWSMEIVAVTPDLVSVNGSMEIDSDLIVHGEIFHSKTPVFNNVTLQNNWLHYASSNLYAAPSYYLDQQGVVHLRGLIKDGNICQSMGNANCVLFTLPADARPEYKGIFLQANSGQGWARVDVLANGTVMITSPSVDSAWLSLEGISFAIAP